MNIVLNGKSKEFPDAIDLHSLAGQYCKDKAPVIAELNGEIIRIPRWKETRIKDGDIVELVSFIGGG